MSEAVIVALGRSAIGKAPRGTLKYTRPEDLATQVIKSVINRLPGLPKDQIDDLVLGCAFPEAEQGMNMGRIVALEAGLGNQVPGQTVNRFCSSGLQAIATASNAISMGQSDIIIAGGVESMSLIPMGGNIPDPDPYMASNNPHVYDSMGITAENVAEKYGISRMEQDELAVISHERALAARESGKFAEEIIPVKADTITKDANGNTVSKQIIFDQDEGIRPGTSLEILAKLRPCFKVNGSVTAGNSSQTSDGAAICILMSKEKAEELGYKPIAKLIGFNVVGVPPETMGIGPMYAIPKVLKRTGLALDNIDLIELNEAFASQAVACIKALKLDMKKVNVNGGAIALGHPLGCTGAALTVKLLYEMRRRELRKGKKGIVSMCIGGGMGAAGIYEML
jgi:acetyl-CoA acyltransferase